MCHGVTVTRQGLGKNSDGRVEPIKIEILPAGKSLDICVELRDKSKQEVKRKRNRGINNNKKKLSKSEVSILIVHINYVINCRLT